MGKIMKPVMPVKFEDIVVRKDATFTLKKTGKVYRLRKLNLLDEAWLQDNFGEADHLHFIAKTSLRNLFKFVYRQLVEKEDFKAVREIVINDEGHEEEITLSGYDVLMRAVDDPAEINEITEALFTVIGFSRPIREKLEKISNDASKKKKVKKQKPNVGEKSLT